MLYGSETWSLKEDNVTRLEKNNAKNGYAMLE